jgi:protein-S-isoprenylcysteine O-methyltransferase Ste14
MVSATALNLWAWIAFLVTWYSTALFVHKTRRREGALRRMHYTLLMAAGFLLIFHSLLNHHVHRRGAAAWTGDVLTIGGILFAAWARYHLGRLWSGEVVLKEGHRLIRTGPYRFARHPLYTGFLTAVLGSAIAGGTIWALGGFVLVLIGILIKMRREEALLTGEFGDEYTRFKQETAALLPFIY